MVSAPDSQSEIEAEHEAMGNIIYNRSHLPMKTPVSQSNEHVTADFPINTVNHDVSLTKWSYQSGFQVRCTSSVIFSMMFTIVKVTH